METYRGFTISKTDPVPPIPTWEQHKFTFVHPDYDGAPDSNDRRYGTAPTVIACKKQIDELLTDEAEAKFAAANKAFDAVWIAYVDARARFNAARTENVDQRRADLEAASEAVEAARKTYALAEAEYRGALAGTPASEVA